MEVGLFIIIITSMIMVLYIIKRVLDIIEANLKTKQRKIKRMDLYDEDFLDERII